MLLVDTNVWLAVSIAGHRHHAAADAWLSAQTASKAMCFCRLTQLSFLRLLTTAAVFVPYGVPPLTNTQAWGVYDALRKDARIGWSDEPAGLDLHWHRFAGIAQTSPKLWMDAYLAAFAIAGRHRLVTADQAFKQFKGLGVVLI